jgi:hypothetical protein
MGTKKALTFRQQIQAINKAVYDTQLTVNERKLYNWLSTQHKHKHIFYIKKSWWETLLKINQKRK